MQRQVFFVIASAWLIASVTPHALAETSFTAKGVKVVDKCVVHQTDLRLGEGPANILDDTANTRFGYLNSEEALVKLWKAWRKDEPPKVDFRKQVVLVLTHFENAEVKITADLDDKGNLKFGVSSTQRVAKGMTYVITVVDRAGIKSINGKPL